MPHVGWEIEGEFFTLEEALHIADTEGHFDRWPSFALRSLHQTREDGADHLSPSGADRCLRQSILKQKYPYYLDPEKQHASVVGNGLHEHYGRHILGCNELFLSVPFFVWVDELELNVEVELKGTIDSYEEQYKRIVDIKTVSEYKKFNPVLRRSADRTAADESHELQVNIYNYLLQKNGYEVEHAAVWYVQTYKEAKRNYFELEPWPLDKTEQIIEQRAREIAIYQHLGRMPEPYDEDHPNFWMCRFCPVSEACRVLADDGQ